MILLYNFRWVIKDILAGCSRPFIKEDLEWLYGQKIRALVCLLENPMYQQQAEELMFEYKYIPIEDYGSPLIEEMVKFVEFVDKMRAKGKSVAAFCDAGLGRTGCMLAVYLVSQGYNVEEAIEKVRKTERQSIHTPGQFQAIHDFSLYCRANSREIRGR